LIRLNMIKSAVIASNPRSTKIWVEERRWRIEGRALSKTSKQCSKTSVACRVPVHQRIAISWCGSAEVPSAHKKRLKYLYLHQQTRCHLARNSFNFFPAPVLVRPNQYVNIQTGSKPLIRKSIFRAGANLKSAMTLHRMWLSWIPLTELYFDLSALSQGARHNWHQRGDHPGHVIFSHRDFLLYGHFGDSRLNRAKTYLNWHSVQSDATAGVTVGFSYWESLKDEKNVGNFCDAFKRELVEEPLRTASSLGQLSRDAWCVVGLFTGGNVTTKERLSNWSGCWGDWWRKTTF